MKVIIVDDEKLALNRLKRLLNEQGIDDVSVFQNPELALDEFRQRKYDIAFLDISMPKINGLELANQIMHIEPKTYIVFQTAFSEFSLQAFENGGMDYILKPIDENSLKKTISKARNFVKTQSNSFGKIVGKCGDEIILVDLKEIYYIEAALDEVVVRTKEYEVYTKRKIGDLEKLLDKNNFFRVHRSSIVNIDKIKSMKSIEQSKLEISFKDIKDKVYSSKDGAKYFREFLEKKSL